MAGSKNTLGSFPNALVVISLTVALFLIGLCGWLVINARSLTTYVKERLEVYAFLEKGLSAGQLDTLYKTVAKKDFVLVSNGSPKINFISKDVAAKNFAQQTEGVDKNFQAFLGENPLRDSYAIKINEGYFEEAKLRKIKVELQEIPGIYEADYAQNFVDGINQNISKIYYILAGSVLLLLLLIIILVNNTIKLAMYSQRFLIRSMQLVGATHNFIRRPFLWRGILQGLIGAMAASVLLISFQQFALYQIPELTILQDLPKFLILIGIIIALGVLIGLVSTFQSVERYLRMALDDLY